MDKCPYCGSDIGFYTKHYIVQEIYFTFDGEPNGSNSGEESEKYTKDKKAYCLDCHKYIGMFRKIVGDSNID